MNAEYLSECYVLAYQKALEMTDDVNLATGAGIAVLNVVMSQARQHEVKFSIDYSKAIKELSKGLKLYGGEEKLKKRGDNNGSKENRTN